MPRAWLRRAVLVALLFLALVRPGVPGGSAEPVTADLNVFFVVDTTTSMVAEDYGKGQPRLEGVRRDILAIAEQLPGARFSVVTFDTKGHVRMPLTTDTLALETITSVLEPQVTTYAKGSSITAAGQALAGRLVAAREARPDRPRIVFYFGDGEQTSAQEPGPLQLDGGLVSGGAVLGYGTPAGGRMKENTGMVSDGGIRDAPYVQDSGTDALSRIDEGRLRAVASQLGVPYVHRSAGDAAEPMMQQARPGALEHSQDAVSVPGRVELYWVFAVGAFVLGLAEARVLIRRFRELRPASASAPPVPAPEREGAR